MKAVDILINLSSSEQLLDKIRLHELSYLQQTTKGFIGLSKEVSSSYSFITLELKMRLIEDNNKLQKPRESLYCKIQFEVIKDKLILKDIYCEDKSRTSAIEKLVKENKTVTNSSWKLTPEQTFYRTYSITHYITIADSIAQKAYNCTSGDNYRPGNFSEIAVNEELITLSQINHMNAKSTSHKDDYSLRKLQFIIPIAEIIIDAGNCDYHIGDMLIEFSDNSSANNKVCGEEIKAKIKQEKELFDHK